jgi:hypothetical protein
VYGFPYQLDHACSLRILENAVDAIGDTPEGMRYHASLKGGTVEGERLKGSIRPVGGAAFSVFRPDDVCDIDVRMCLEMHDGALIYLRYGGVFDLGPGGVRKLLAGDMKGKHFMHTVPRMITAHRDYAWVNRKQFVGIGEVDFDEGVVHYDIYALNSK